MNKYKDVDFGTAEAVFNKLGGKEGIKDFLSGKTVLSFPNGKRAWPVWKTIKIGNFSNVVDLSNSLNKNEINFDSDKLDFEILSKARAYYLALDLPALENRKELHGVEKNCKIADISPLFITSIKA